MSKPGHLQSNFDRNLEKLLCEASTWKKLISVGINVSNFADEFTSLHKENLRVMK